MMLPQLTQQDGAALGAAASAAASVATWSAEQATLHFVGVPLPVLLAAFAGALASLSFSAPMRMARLVGTVASSTAIGAYLQPAAEHLLRSSLGLEGAPLAVAFLGGLAAQAVIGWALRSIPEILDRLRGAGR